MNSASQAAGPWIALRRYTVARIATGRTGGSLPTAELLRFGLDHAIARDAVHAELDFHALERALASLALSVVRIQTQVTDRPTYLKRPDLGQRLELVSRARLIELAQAAAHGPDIVIIVADGLSAEAARMHAPPLLFDLVPRLVAARLTLGPFVIARYARVALQDEVGVCLRARSCLILLGERPGLAAPDSLGGYFVFNPRIGNTDANRNCVSNIRPDGLSFASAADTLNHLITESLRRQLSGTSLKDERPLRPQLNRLR